MGKTTLFHPVSLHVIRGAAEYCGWRFGKIKQTFADLDNDIAIYDAEIVVIPDRVKGAFFSAMLEDLRACFVSDIEADWLRQTKSGKWVVTLTTRALGDDDNG